LTELRFGAFDYYSGLDHGRTSVIADFPVNGTTPGTQLIGQFVQGADHVWSLFLDQPIAELAEAQLTLRVFDAAGNKSEIACRFSVLENALQGFPIEIWRQPSAYNPAFDSNGNQLIEVLDLIGYMEQIR
jgi:hypothetical protein